MALTQGLRSGSDQKKIACLHYYVKTTDSNTTRCTYSSLFVLSALSDPGGILLQTLSLANLKKMFFFFKGKNSISHI